MGPARAFSFCRAKRGNQSGFRSKKVRALFSNCDQLRHFENSEAVCCSLAPPEFIPHGEARPAEGGASEQTLSPENLKCLDWSGCRELNPGHLLPKQAYYRYTTAR